MKIAFWSNAKGKCGVTSNLACISIASSIKYAYRTVLIENHDQNNTLENVLMYNRGNYHARESDNLMFQKVGMNHVLNQIAAESYNTENRSNHTLMLKEKEQWMIKEASLEILDNSLYYIPTNNTINRETFDYNLYGNINNILKALESFADITFIDTSNHNSLSSKIILDEVDLVVVNLIQNSYHITNFFENYSSILSKCVFLISSYRNNSKLNINKISKTHLINKSNIATIPFNVEYQEAVSQGTVIEFLSRNYRCKKDDPNYPFVHEVKKAVNMIFRQVEILSRKEVCH
jgi:hypothetical protein